MYKYEIWFDHCMLTQSGDFDYETYEEAEEEAVMEIEQFIIQAWKDNGCYRDETVEDFKIRINRK